MKGLFAFPIRTLAFALTVAGAAACGKGDGLTDPGNNNTQTALLDITNNTSVSVFFVRIRACGTTAWGNDLLGADIIPAGLGQSFTVPAGCHDVRLETSALNNGVAEYLGVAFPSGGVVHKTVSSWSTAQ